MHVQELLSKYQASRKEFLISVVLSTKRAILSDVRIKAEQGLHSHHVNNLFADLRCYNQDNGAYRDNITLHPAEESKFFDDLTQLLGELGYKVTCSKDKISFKVEW